MGIVRKILKHRQNADDHDRRAVFNYLNGNDQLNI